METKKNKSIIKTIFEGNILIPLPKVLLENRYHSMLFRAYLITLNLLFWNLVF